MTDDYLWRTLQAAYHQATLGKGKERHGSSLPFDQQPIMAIARMQDGSIDGHLFQVMKKAQEAGRMAKRGDGEAATRELYGVIVYAAAAAMSLAASRAAANAALQRITEECPWQVKPVASEDESEPLSAADKQSKADIAYRRRRAAIDSALEAIRLQEHEVDPVIVREVLRKQREAAIDRAGEKLRAGEFKLEDDNG